MRWSWIVLGFGAASVMAASAAAADFRLLPGFRPGSATVVDLDQLNGQSGPMRHITTYGVLRDPLPGPHGAAVVGVDTDVYDCPQGRFWPSALVLYDTRFRRVATSPPGRDWVKLEANAGAEVDYSRIACRRDPAILARGSKLKATTWPAAVVEARRRLLLAPVSPPRRAPAQPAGRHGPTFITAR